MKKILFLILVLNLAACGDEKKEDQAQTQTDSLHEKRVGKTSIIPLATGSRWIYDVLGYDTTAHALRPFKIDTFHVVSDTVIEGTRWFKIDGLANESAYATNWDDGLYYTRLPGKPFLFVKYPAVLGDTFTSQIGMITAHTTVAATDLEVKVPAGTFYCLKYAQVAGPAKVNTNYYFAPGAGLIKMEIMDRTGKYPIAQNVLAEIKRE